MVPRAKEGAGSRGRMEADANDARKARRFAMESLSFDRSGERKENREAVGLVVVGTAAGL